MEIKDCAELKCELEKSKIIIYGAGYVADRFYKALSKHGWHNKVLFFVTTEGSDKCMNGFVVKSVDALSKNDEFLICIAVHESIRNEISRTLDREGISNYVWVYPFLNELILGKPLYENKKISIRSIWKANKSNFSIAARYLAVEEYYGQKLGGYKSYLSCLSLFNERETSEKRLAQFIRLMKEWKTYGYDEGKPIILLADGRVLDGFHRVAIAIYHGQREMICTQYGMSDDIGSTHEPIALLTEESVLDAGLDNELILKLKKTNERIERVLYEDKCNYPSI